MAMAMARVVVQAATGVGAEAVAVTGCVYD